jgi:hypothetical protein
VTKQLHRISRVIQKSIRCCIIYWNFVWELCLHTRKLGWAVLGTLEIKWSIFDMYVFMNIRQFYEGSSESKERVAIKRYLLIIGKKQNMQHLYSRICRFYHTTSPTSAHSHLGHWGTCPTVTPIYLIPSSYQKAAVTNVHKFCGIANVWWQFRTQLYETHPDIVRTLR